MADDVAYIQMTQAQADASYGKLQPGRILRVDQDRADRWITAGLAEPSDEGAYQQQLDARVETIKDREGRFAQLNRDDKAALWDVSTHRDALTAPEAGLRAAVEAGVPLVNLGRLRTPEGLPIDPDASVEEILEARQNLHPELLAPLTSHERASTSGGGSHYDMPMPLNPELRQQERIIRQNERNAQSEAYANEQEGQAASQDTTTLSPSIRQQAAARRSQAQHSEKPAPPAPTPPSAPTPPPS